MNFEYWKNLVHKFVGATCEKSSDVLDKTLGKGTGGNSGLGSLGTIWLIPLYDNQTLVIMNNSDQTRQFFFVVFTLALEFRPVMKFIYKVLQK